MKSKSRWLLSVLLAAALITACLPIVELAPTRRAAGELPQGTQALPPAFTPTIPPPPTITPAPTPDSPVEDQRLGLLPAYGVDIVRLREATRYWIEIEINFADQGRSAFVDGRVRILFTNPLEDRLGEIALMLWPNNQQYAASMVAGPALIQGEVVEGQAMSGDPALIFDLPRSIGPGEALDLSLPFQVEIEQMNAMGPRRMGITEGVLLAPTFYPLVPPLVEGVWQTADAPAGGDTTNSDIALYQLEVTWPSDLALVASGVEIDRRENGDTSIATIVSGPMRDLAFALGPFVSDSLVLDDVELKAWVLPQHQEDMDVLLEAAGVQIELLGELLGPYPYPELDLVDAPGAFGGIEYPGLVYLGTLGTSWVIEPTVHEVAHQWFYGLIGGDQIREPWLDEAAATYAEALYYEAARGAGRGTGFLSELRAIVRSQPNPALPIGLAVGDYQSEFEYAAMVYFKGALFFDALRNALGEHAFKVFLREYFEAYRFGIADSAGFQQIAERSCSCDLAEIFDLWVYEGGTILELE